MTKIYQIAIIILLAVVLGYAVMYDYKSKEADRYKANWEESESKVENLQGRINADVEASKQKAKLKNTMDNSKDMDNLKHVPDADILNQLRSSPV